MVTAMLRKPPTGRPSLARVVAVVQAATADPAPAMPVIAELQQANAVEAERVSEAAARAEEERRRIEERERHIAAGMAILGELLTRLEQVVREHAPEADISWPRAGRRLMVRIGATALLRVDIEGAVPPDIVFDSSHWESVAIARIKVQQGGEWSHGATLWYMKLPGSDEDRWYEVSYRRNALTGGPVVGPFAIQILGSNIYQQADLAAGPAMHSIEMESPPTPVDDEATDAFVGRWLDRLVRAYNGRLRPL